MNKTSTEQNDKENDSVIYFMVGVPGSGKSFVAEKKSEEFGIPILSSDNLREELTGDAGNQEIPNEKIFKELGDRAEKSVEKKESFIWDSVNIDSEYRREYIKQFKKNGAKVICLLMTTPKNICIERNKDRARVVPTDVVEEMDSKLTKNEIDTKLDLFDEIKTIDEKGQEIKVYDRGIDEEMIVDRETRIFPKIKLK